MCQLEPDIWIWQNGDIYEYIAMYIDSLYNSQLEDTLNNTSCLPCSGFEPKTSSCGTRKELFCAQLHLPLAALPREYFYFYGFFTSLLNIGTVK